MRWLSNFKSGWDFLDISLLGLGFGQNLGLEMGFEENVGWEMGFISPPPSGPSFTGMIPVSRVFKAVLALTRLSSQRALNVFLHRAKNQ